MPSSMTHSYFSLDVYDKLNKKLQKEIDLEKLKVFSQGPDFYYFYHFLLNRNKDKYYDIGRKMHRSYVFDYFFGLINYINENDLKENKEIKTYLFGHICHYILDMTTHPFIFYKTGVYNKSNKKTYKYNSLHPDMEYYIDAYLIYQKEQKLPYHYKVYKNIFNITTFNNELENMINYTMKEIYNVNNASKIYLKGIKRTKLFFKLFCSDKLGLKKKTYQLIDTISSNKFPKLQPFSYHVALKKKIHYLNLEKKEWNHPSNSNEVYNYSFIELYLQALNTSVTIINEINTMLENKKIDKDNLFKLLKDNSYLTGKPWNEKNKMKYFEF